VANRTGMTRRQLLEAAAGLSAGLALSPSLLAATGQAPGQPQWRNWAGNLSAQPQAIKWPTSEDEVVDLVRNSSGGIRPVGSGHSWTGLVPTGDTIVSLDRLSGLVDHDPATLQAEVLGGTKLFAYGPLVEEVGQAIRNMSDINYQTMAGAISTSTHGTGRTLGCMSDFVVGLQLVTPAGEVIECSADKNPDLFDAARSGLGALGIITRLRFQNREKHRLHQQTWLQDLDETLEDIDRLADDNQQMELFPFPNSNRTLVVTTNEADPALPDHIHDDPNALLQLREVFEKISKVPLIDEFLFNKGLDFEISETEHRVGPSYQVLAHIRAIPFMEMEYTVPAEKGVECLREVMATIEKKAPHICFPLEYRYIKADDTMIGMFSGQDGTAISVHQFADDPNWRDYLAAIEPVFWKYGGRPHWGKWHSLGYRQLSGLYPDLKKFRSIQEEIDPQGRMLNKHLRHVLGQS